MRASLYAIGLTLLCLLTLPGCTKGQPFLVQTTTIDTCQPPTACSLPAESPLSNGDLEGKELRAPLFIRVSGMHPCFSEALKFSVSHRSITALEKVISRAPDRWRIRPR
ncbi:Rz1-like lysis system protein LysC [Pseudomonas sp. 2FE]|uniref:Rz1-like lysis system protein LysC n=1 Tax=Pseudomonas sp. 2FE TaxID=2502190 RepID=UPI001C49864F